MTLLKFWSTAKIRRFFFCQLIESLIKVSIKWQLFRCLIKKFDQVKRSSEIRSSECFPYNNSPSNISFKYRFEIVDKAYYLDATSMTSLSDLQRSIRRSWRSERDFGSGSNRFWPVFRLRQTVINSMNNV